MYQVLLTHYGFSMSSGHAAPTRIADYVAVPEEAAGLLDHAECHSTDCPPFIHLLRGVI